MYTHGGLARLIKLFRVRVNLPKSTDEGRVKPAIFAMLPTNTFHYLVELGVHGDVKLFRVLPCALANTHILKAKHTALYVEFWKQCLHLVPDLGGHGQEPFPNKGNQEMWTEIVAPGEVRRVLVHEKLDNGRELLQGLRGKVRHVHEPRRVLDHEISAKDVAGIPSLVPGASTISAPATVVGSFHPPQTQALLGGAQSLHLPNSSSPVAYPQQQCLGPASL
mmetsp:Transcript_13051/g.37945  ORF Transcript_13051/g.37945 Transcript_13051/m.37945 type:complete len:221 (-) Transcript_13051:96-758(-)